MTRSIRSRISTLEHRGRGGDTARVIREVGKLCDRIDSMSADEARAFA